jgi:hypothetical protein
MTLEQVNVQELQRLNDAITITMDAIRRVAPQLAWIGLQQSWQPAHPLAQLAYSQQPFGVQHPFGIGQSPFGIGQQLGLGQSPFGIGQQLGFGQSPFGIGHYGVQPFGVGQQLGAQVDPITAQYIQDQVLRNVLGQRGPQLGQSPWQAPLQSSYSPFLNLQQRPF